MQAQRGVTLIELMVAVAVIFIVSAIAIPAYQDYLQVARQETLLARAAQFQLFMDNYHVDNNTYLAGQYDPAGGINDFAGPLGYRVDNDDQGIAFRVEAGACGNIANCYRVVMTNAQGEQLQWTPTAWTFSEP